VHSGAFAYALVKRTPLRPMPSMFGVLQIRRTVRRQIAIAEIIRKK